MKEDINNILKINDLSVGYSSGKAPVSILEGINSGLRKGELICLLGANGVGKSTLLRTLTGLQKPLLGDILIQDLSIAAYDKKELSQKISVVLTDRIHGNLSVFEVMALGRHPHTSWRGRLSEKDLEKIDWAFKITGMDFPLSRKFYMLSDGQRQKVMIARALVQDSDIIVLDEPTTHLDIKNKWEVMRLLRLLTQTTAKGILVATHEVEMALHIADKWWLASPDKSLKEGVPEDFILDNTVAEVFDHTDLVFDRMSGSFSISNTRKLPDHITITGDPVLQKWTRQALEKRNFFQALSQKNITIKVYQQGEQVCWEYVENGEAFTKLESLLEALAKPQ